MFDISKRAVSPPGTHKTKPRTYINIFVCSKNSFE